MSSNGNGSPPDASPNPRRGSFTAQTFGNLFGRSNSTSGAPTAPFPAAISITTSQDPNRRRMSISTLGLSGASPTQVSPFPFGARRASISTSGSDSIDENAVDDEEGPSRSTPVTPFIRRISFGAQALRNARTGNGGNSPNAQGRTPPSHSTISSRERSGSKSGRGAPPGTLSSSQASKTSKPKTASNLPSTRPAEGTGFNWSEQLRSRAESSVSHSHRPSLSTSPSNRANRFPTTHERAKSISDMPAPPAATIPPPQPQPQQPARPARRQPDAFQERILKGDFYMD